MRNKVQKLFSKAYVLGGSPCSGKSTIAERIASQFGLQYYKVDDHEKNHMARVHPEQHPIMYAYSKMGWNEIWMRSVKQQVQEEFDFYRERFEMIVEDLQGYAAQSKILLEGAAYLPELLFQSKFDAQRVVYMIPTKTFQVEHYSKRAWIQHILKECKDPKQAFENWMERDHLFGEEIIKQAQKYGFQVVKVDGSLDIDRQYTQIVKMLGLG